MGRSNQILDFGLDALALKKGGNSEDRVEECLKTLLSTGDIERYIRVRANDELDGRGIDFIVWLFDTTCVCLQVKSSEAGRKAHYEVYGEHIPCVVVRPNEGAKSLKKKVMVALSIYVGNIVPTNKKKHLDPGQVRS